MSDVSSAASAITGPLVFVDADVLLHYPPLNELPWTELCPDARAIAICLTVVGQVDSKKNDPRLRDRAVRAVSDIRRFRSQGQVRDALPFLIYHDSVRDEEVEHPLTPSCVDDRILTAVLQAGRSNPNWDPRFMSGDYVVEIKCQTLGLPFVSLERVARLSPPADEHTKKTKALERQLVALQARMPDLKVEAESLGILQTTGHVNACHSTSKDGDGWIDDVVAKEIQETVGGLGRLAQMGDDFRAEWEEYFKSLRQHCSLMACKARMSARTIVCKLSLANRGTAPATHVDVRIGFPTHVRLIDKTSECGVILTSVQDPPRRPVTRSPFSPLRWETPPDVAAALNRIPIKLRNERVPECVVALRTDDNGTDGVEIRLGRIQQGEHVACCEVLVVFGEGGSVTPLELSCIVTASEVPAALKENVGVIIKKAQSTSVEWPK